MKVKQENLRLAKLEDLRLGTTYYWKSGSKMVRQTVRGMVKAQNRRGRDETMEEYELYRQFLRDIVRLKECYVHKDNKTNKIGIL